MGERTGTWDSEFRGPLKSRLMWKRPSRLLFVCILSLFLTRRHRGAPRKHVACAWLQTITKHDIVAPAGAAEVTKHVRGEQAAWAAIGDEAAALGRRSALPPAPPTAAAATTCGDWLGSQHRTRLISAGISSSTRTVDGGECTSESGVVPSGIGPRFAERTERFCGGMRYLWRIRSHVQAVPHCPYARQRTTTVPSAMYCPPPSFRAGGGQCIAGGTAVITLAGIRTVALPGHVTVCAASTACPRKSVRRSANRGLMPEGTTPLALVLSPLAVPFALPFYHRGDVAYHPPTLCTTRGSTFSRGKKWYHRRFTLSSTVWSYK